VSTGGNSVGSAKIPWDTGQQSSVDPLAGATPCAVNVLVDDGGAVHLRPGISTWSAFAKPPLFAASAVQGIQVFQGSLVWITADRLIHRLVADNYAVDLSSASATTQLDGSARPTFAVCKSLLAIAGAGEPQKWDGSSALSARLGGSPPPASHIVAMNQGLIVNVLGNTGQMQWSDTTLENWPGLNFIELANDPDPLIGLYKNSGEIIGLGTASVQVMAPTTATVDNQGTLFFTYLPSRNFDFGTDAPYSFIAADQDGGESFYFLDERHRFVQSDNRSITPISDLIQKQLNALGTWSDCWGFRLHQDAWDLLCWIFPTVGRGFMYDMAHKRWSEIKSFSDGNWAPWIGQSAAPWGSRGLNLVGLGDGTIGTFDFGSASEGGSPVVGEVVTGFQDRGTRNKKHCQRVRFTFRRGLPATGTGVPPSCQVTYRDDLGQWEDWYTLDMGSPTDPAPTVELSSLGIYRERQWRIRMSDSVPLTLVEAEETYEVSDL
jgi:hypothetical protein